MTRHFELTLSPVSVIGDTPINFVMQRSRGLSTEARTRLARLCVTPSEKTISLARLLPQPTLSTQPEDFIAISQILCIESIALNIPTIPFRYLHEEEEVFIDVYFSDGSSLFLNGFFRDIYNQTNLILFNVLAELVNMFATAEIDTPARTIVLADVGTETFRLRHSSGSNITNLRAVALANRFVFENFWLHGQDYPIGDRYDR